MPSNDKKTQMNVNIYHNKFDYEELKKVAKETDLRVQKILDDYTKKYTEEQKREHFFDKDFVLYEFSKYSLDVKELNTN